MSKDLKSYKNFTKEYVRCATETESAYVVDYLKKKKRLETLFYIVCTMVAIIGAVVFIVEACKHTIWEYNYISIVFSVFFCIFAVCYLYDLFCRIRENKMLKQKNFYVARGEILEVVSRSARSTQVKFIADDKWCDEMQHNLYGTDYKKGDKVILLAFFDKKDVLCSRMLLPYNK